jgi:hypothetical protein
MCKRFFILFSYDGVKAIECNQYNKYGDAGDYKLLAKLIGDDCEFTERWSNTPVLKLLEKEFGVTCYVNETPLGHVNPFSKNLGRGVIDPIFERKVLECNNSIFLELLRREKEQVICGQIICVSIKNAPFTDYISKAGVNAVCEFLKLPVEFIYLDESKKDEECDGSCVHLRSFLLRKECLCGNTVEDGKEMKFCESCFAKLYCDGCFAEEHESHKKVCVF